MSFPEALDPRRAKLPRIQFPNLSVPRLRRPNVSLRSAKRPSRGFVLIALLFTLLIAIASFFLVRNSSLVQVREVKIVGLEGYYDKNARRAVREEALRMTTMNFDADRVEEAAAAFVSVAGVEVKTDFPHSVVIDFDVRRPVLRAKVNGRTVTLSQSGEIMTAQAGASSLPTIDTTGTIEGDKVVGGRALAAAKILGAAPDILLRKVDTIRFGRLGLMITLTSGPTLYFGDSADAVQKWKDAAAVLANAATKGLAYIDLRAPGRPAIGGLGAAPVTATSIDGEEESLPEQEVSTATDDSSTDVVEQPAPSATTEPQTDAQTQAPAQNTSPAPSQGAAGGATITP